jgi:maltose alpha-D-glucosyltransferase/alpha-amylase
VSLAILHRFASAGGDAWALALKALHGFVERARATSDRPPRIGASAGALFLAREDRILSRFRSLLDRAIPACRIRCHGNDHLQQVLCKGDAFTVIDFEGEPRRPLGERRLKRSPLHDVASMLRSFDFAARHTFADRGDAAAARHGRVHSTRQPWSRFWRGWVSAPFLREYVGIARREQLVPPDRDVLIPLLDVYLLERAIYELGYELEERPAWVAIPLLAILELLDTRSDEDRPHGDRS